MLCAPYKSTQHLLISRPLVRLSALWVRGIALRDQRGTEDIAHQHWAWRKAGNRARHLGETPPRGYDCRLMLRIT